MERQSGRTHATYSRKVLKSAGNVQLQALSMSRVSLQGSSGLRQSQSPLSAGHDLYPSKPPPGMQLHSVGKRQRTRVLPARRCRAWARGAAEHLRGFCLPNIQRIPAVRSSSFHANKHWKIISERRSDLLLWPTSACSGGVFHLH